MFERVVIVLDSLDIRVRGIVQGVGFRPFVYRLAKRYLVNGWVLNDVEGVFIHAEAEAPLLDEFVTELHMNPPAAAKISEVELMEVPLQDCTSFEIRESRDDDVEDSTLVSADLATCDECLHELFDSADRRYRYPFINCTNCGPRFTIIDKLPYDRPSTSMASFDMCDACAREYSDPLDRRFHAQPDACFECGPHLTWADLTGDAHLAEPANVKRACNREQSDALIEQAVRLIADGGIIAVKGLGGFHLVCDASNEAAIARLRERKRRGSQAFAVMVGDIDAARAVCEVSAAEGEVLASAARPIVLLRKRACARLAAGLADGLPELGVMLPATPVQHLLIHDFQKATGRFMLVMTSGNVHDEPIVIDDGTAYERLYGIADAVLGNDRPILSRYDDSVVRVLSLGGTDAQGRPNEALQFIRRARGFAPVPIPLKDASKGEVTDSRKPDAFAPAAPAVFAAGPEQKATLAFAHDDKAYVSQHIGDMEDADVYDAWFESKSRLEKLFGLRPRIVACDMHPEYLASKWARANAARDGLELVEVQHHHAHIASVLGEHGLFGPAMGFSFDGTGYGADGAIWGGEVLIANQADYERFANFSYMPMPGGAAAVKNPLRMAYGALWAYDLLDHPGARKALANLGNAADVCDQMIESGLNTPMTSSLGRLFDAVSALLGICTNPSYEGEAAIALDAARAAFAQSESSGADRADMQGERYAITIAKNSAVATSTAHDTSVVLLDAERTLRAVLDDMATGVDAGLVSLRFHEAIVNAVVQVAELVRAMYDINLVVLSGGCFMNRYLTEQATARLGKAGFTVALNANLPPNDGCIAYGQAVVARAR